jgi:hypothetical protein
MGHNKAWAAQGETLSLYTSASAEVLQHRTIFITRRDNLERCYDLCRAALAEDYALSGINSLQAFFLQGLERRAYLIKKDHRRILSSKSTDTKSTDIKFKSDEINPDKTIK